jgi:hypothetical protein
MCDEVPSRRERISDSKPLCIDVTKQTVATPRVTPTIVIQVETETKNRPEPKYLRAMKDSNDMWFPYGQTPPILIGMVTFASEPCNQNKQHKKPIDKIPSFVVIDTETQGFFPNGS